MSDYTPPTLVTPTPGGSAGDGNLNGTLNVQANAGTAGSLSKTLLSAGTDLSKILDLLGGSLELSSPSGTIAINDGLYLRGEITGFNDEGVAGYGVPAIFGVNKRTGLTAADASAITLRTTTAANQLYRLMGRILATAGTSPSATYTIKWTEGGATITKTLTISALDSDSDLSVLIQPDNGTVITAQLTAISGTGTTVNVAATVEQMA